jgi:hypothetical protein
MSLIKLARNTYEISGFLEYSSPDQRQQILMQRFPHPGRVHGSGFYCNFIEDLSTNFLLNKKNFSAFSNTELILAGGYMNGTLSDVVEKYNIQTGKGNFTIFLFYTPM